MTDLRRRFILFSMLVISVIMVLASLLLLLHAHSDASGAALHRWLVTAAVFIAMVFAGSWLISRRAVAPIEKAWQKQLDFTADASHELRTPLAAIRANLEILLDCREESVESQRKWLENIDAESRRMTKLVDDLLTLARADTHKQELVCEDFSLRQAASEAVAAFEAAASQQGMSLALQMQENIMLQGDRGRLKQLLMILLDNAIRYSGGKGIVVAADCRKGSVALKVRDDGCGIGQEHLGRLFERFYRVAELRGKNPDGSGLGLAIARWIAEGHGGSISVHSTLGKGTEFVVRLPVRNARQKNKKVLAQNLNP